MCLNKEQLKRKDDYIITKGTDQHQYFIRSNDLDDEIVLLYLDGSISKQIKCIHDCGSNVHQIDIPIDCIDAFIEALTLLKNSSPELKDTQRKHEYVDREYF